MTNPLNVSIRLLEVLPIIVHHIRRQAREAVKGRITLPQFRTLAQIGRGISTVNELAEIQSVAQPTMSKMVDGLAKRGLVKRKASVLDRRQIHLELTGKGRSNLNQGMKALQHQLSREISTLSKDELKQLSIAIRNLDILKDRFRAG